MVSNMAKGIQLQDVARAAGLSSFHFAHMFKHTTGMGPHRYLTLARVERLKELLRATETTLNELALSVGFSDQSHMTRVFKRFTGATPNAYRRALQS
jgi:AraC family transcriptional regulator